MGFGRKFVTGNWKLVTSDLRLLIEPLDSSLFELGEPKWSVILQNCESLVTGGVDSRNTT